MKMKAKNSGGDGNFELPPAGTHAACCVAIIDLGTHTEDYQGTSSDKEKIYLVFELVDENKSDGTSHFIGRDYAATLGKKANLRKLLVGWRGRDFEDGEEQDMEKLVGKSCLVGISHKQVGERTYAQLDSVTQPMKGQLIGKPSVQPFLWEMGDGNDAPSEDWLPFIYGQKVADVIAESHERTGRKAKGGAKSVASAEPEYDAF